MESSSAVRQYLVGKAESLGLTHEEAYLYATFVLKVEKEVGFNDIELLIFSTLDKRIAKKGWPEPDECLIKNISSDDMRGIAQLIM